MGAEKEEKLLAESKSPPRPTREKQRYLSCEAKWERGALLPGGPCPRSGRSLAADPACLKPPKFGEKELGRRQRAWCSKAMFLRWAGGG